MFGVSDATLASFHARVSIGIKCKFLGGDEGDSLPSKSNKVRANLGALVPRLALGSLLIEQLPSVSAPHREVTSVRPFPAVRMKRREMSPG